LSSIKSKLTFCPIEGMMVLKVKLNSDPWIGNGLRLPLSSGSPNFIFIQCKARPSLSSTEIDIGAVNSTSSTPSSIIVLISSGSAGISFFERR